MTRSLHVRSLAQSVDVENLETYDRQVSSSRPFLKNCFSNRKRRARTPPSTFLFLPIHLSNSPGPKSPYPSLKRRAVEASKHPTEAGACFHRISMRSFEGAPSPSGGAPVGGLYVPPLRIVNTALQKFRTEKPDIYAPFGGRSIKLELLP